MTLKEHKVLLFVVVAALALIAISPVLQPVLTYPQTEFFTEFSLFGPEHDAEGIPFNITRNENIRAYLNISNHLGRRAYYSIQVKFRTINQPVPDIFGRTPSNLSPITSVNVYVDDNETWELPVTCSFDYSYSAYSSNVNLSKVNLRRLNFNSAVFDLNRSIPWNSTKAVYFGNLIFELWIYNDDSGSFQYHERYVDMKFNMTV